MHPYEEGHPYEARHPPEAGAPHGDWEADALPDPSRARTGAEFVAELDVLLQWSGFSLEEIEDRARAYDAFLPEGTVAGVLRADTAPSEELLVTLLWAVGCDDETVQLWVWARQRLLPPKPSGYSDGGLAQAVRKRQDRSGWRGLHRHAVPEAGHARRADWSSRAMIALVAAGVIALTAGIAAVIGGADDAAPSTASGDSPAPGAHPTSLRASIVDTATPAPTATTTKPSASPTPRPTATTQRPQTTPTQTETQPQPPRLSGSGSAGCTRQDGRWFVDVSVTVVLTGATSGNNPQGGAGHGETTRSLVFSGSDGTSFTGQARIDAGPDTAALQGTVQWSARVTVPGSGPVETSGSESFNCA